MRKTLILIVPFLLLTTGLASFAGAQPSDVLKNAAKQKKNMAGDALALWDYAELGYKEQKSVALLQERLLKAGFKVEAGVAGMPTAFVASYRNGSGPVIGILAEYDALPGLSQAAVPERQQTPGKNTAHGCGHNLFGAASVASAIAVKEWMQESGTKGEIRLYGCPAEEGGSGKVYLVREGLFKDVEAVIHWHPADMNGFTTAEYLSVVSAKFRFSGVSSHAAAAPERGRSALDGLLVMKVAVEFLREHIPDQTRIHYVITNGGKAPNVVPDFAEGHLTLRHMDPKIVQSTWERVIEASRGAAMATGTTVTHEVIASAYNILVNHTLLDVAVRSFNAIPIEPWSEEDIRFAKSMSEQLDKKGVLDPTVLIPPDPNPMLSGSTDVGDVTWNVPTVGIRTMTWVPGTAAHTWQSSATSGTSFGIHGAYTATNVMSLIAAELIDNPEIVKKAKAEMLKDRGEGFVYTPFLGDRKPPLDYRDNVK